MADQHVIQEQTDEIKRMLEFLLSDEDELKRNGLLSKNSIYDKLKNLQESMKKSKIFSSTGSFLTLYDLDDYLQTFNTGFN